MAKKKIIKASKLKPRIRSVADNTSKVSRNIAKEGSAPRKKSLKYVFFFGGGKADGDRSKRDLLGGKGSGLAEMTNAGLPVPPGFTVSTDVCTLFYGNRNRVPALVEIEIEAKLRRLERLTRSKLGSSNNPLLVSVR